MCSKISAAFFLALALLAACGPTPPSPLSSPTNSSTNGGDSTGTTTGGSTSAGSTTSSSGTTTSGGNDPHPGDPNSQDPSNGGNGNNPNAQNPNAQNPNTQNPNAQNPNAQNPNTQNPNAQNPNTQNPNAPAEVTAFFSPSTDNADLMFVVVTSDSAFCSRLAANAVQKNSVETQLQVADPSGAGTYAIPTEAQVGNLDLNAKCEGTLRDVASGSVTFSTVSSVLVSGSYQFVNGNASGSENFVATPCPYLADGMPSGSATSSLICQ